VRSHGPVSFPCNLHPLPASHFPVSKLLCTSPLCLPHLLFLSCPRVLDYSVRNQPIRPFLPCPVPRVPAFPSVGPEYFIRAPLPSPSALRINVPRANTVFLQGQSVSLRRLRHRHHPAIGSKPSAALDAFKLSSRLANTSAGLLPK
jgi:hypothetical protein